MLQFACAMIDISLSRPTLKENGDSQKFLPVFNSAQQARRGALPHIPLSVKIFVVTFSGRNEVGINVEFITVDSNLAIDYGTAAGMIW
jgi:hypothetical protein